MAYHFGITPSDILDLTISQIVEMHDAYRSMNSDSRE